MAKAFFIVVAHGSKTWITLQELNWGWRRGYHARIRFHELDLRRASVGVATLITTLVTGDKGKESTISAGSGIGLDKGDLRSTITLTVAIISFSTLVIVPLTLLFPKSLKLPIGGVEVDRPLDPANENLIMEVFDDSFIVGPVGIHDKKRPRYASVAESLKAFLYSSSSRS